jgi:hypothetical protein
LKLQICARAGNRAGLFRVRPPDCRVVASGEQEGGMMVNTS